MRKFPRFFEMLIGSMMGSACGHAQAEELRAAIPPQPLASALQTWAQNTGWQLMYDSGLAVNRQSNGASEGLNSVQSLKSVLAGTELEYQFLNDRTVLILPSSGEKSIARPFSALMFKDGSTNFDSELPYVAAHDSTTNNSTATSGASKEGYAPLAKREEKIEEVIVTAQKREERLQDVPISISVLSGDGLDKSSLVSITDALSMMPGVVVQTNTQGAGTYVAVRGVTAGAPVFVGSSPSAYYLDTVPFGLVRSAIGPDTNAYDLERIEVLKGPQGTLYGASAQSGVVRVLTRDADLNDYELKARGGLSTTDGSSSGSSYRADMAINVPIVDGKLGARAVVGYQNLGGWIDNQVERDINDAQLRTYRLKLNAQPAGSLSLGLSAWISRNDYGAPSMSDDDHFLNGAVSQWIDTEIDVFGLKIGYEFDNFSVTSMTGYLDYRNDSRFDTSPIGLAIGVPILVGTYLSTDFNSRVVSEELLFASLNTTPWRWSAGAFYRDAKDDTHQEFPGIQPVPLDHRDTSESYAVFGEFGRRFFRNQLEWTLGLRYFHDNVTNQENILPSTAQVRGPLDSFHATTPRAVLTWYPNEKFTMYGSYSEGFRSGFSHGPIIVSLAPGIPPVKPDKLHNYEIGAKGTAWNDRLSFETALYYMRWDDVQQVNGIAAFNSFFLAPLNGESASGPGVDFAVTVRPIDGLNLGLNVSWNDLTQDEDVIIGGFVQIRKGDRLNYSSEYTASASADYTFPFGASGFNGIFSGSGTYSSAQSNTSLAVGSPSITTTGDAFLIARASFTVESPRGWSAMLYGDNLSNDDGGYPGINTIRSYIARVRPRVIGVQFDYSFR